MALGSSFLAILVLTLAVAASPLEARNGRVSLPLARRTNSTGVTNVLARDQARAQFLKNRGHSDLRSRSGSIAAVNLVDTYVVSVGIGEPATDYTLIVDTGSSNTWVGANKAFVATPNTVNTGNIVDVSYGSGSFFGDEYSGTITLGNGLSISKQSFGVALEAKGFSGVDGIIGIGPIDLTRGTVQDTNEVPTVTQNLYTQKVIGEQVVSVSFAPTTSESDANGELTFGGTDPSKYTGSIAYTSVIVDDVVSSNPDSPSPQASHNHLTC
ncbi:uncharacterized protein FIBRA_03076 [Fibroporia radiculosa]|uniref:Peptidase A1 domain-containing protein n=1 Tax=Fibroporia radiculosa TaxID=599839 RepID=J4G422_9APHY|nr:uncharacterized protein FIBRA_03076 [Fibroporia radiculosa]CCM01028.1 predicted protein [Fibroporia radiculosa]